MRRLLALALILPALAAPPRLEESRSFPPALRPQLDRLREAAMGSDWAYQRLEHLCDTIGPRLAGSPQAAEATRWVASEMRALGLEVELQECLVPHWVRGEERAEVVRYPGQPVGLTQKLSLTALGGSAPTPPGGLTAEIRVVRSLEELDSPATRGKIAVIDRAYDDRLAEQGEGGVAYGQAAGVRVAGPERAAKNGALACLVRSVGGAEFRLPHTGVTVFKDVPAIPAAALAEEDAELLARLSRGGPVEVRLELTCQNLPPAPDANVIADLVGSRWPEQVVIVSGHLDSWDLGTGALDDGAGVVMAMQAAHLMRELGLRPLRTVRVIAWANEENGGAGSDAYFERERGNLPNHFAAIESDLGAGHPYGFAFQGKSELAPVLAPIASALAPIGAGAVRQTPYSGADISNLARAGVPGFHPLVDSRTYFDYHHTAADTLDKVDPQALRENCAVMAVLAYALASLP